MSFFGKNSEDYVDDKFKTLDNRLNYAIKCLNTRIDELEAELNTLKKVNLVQVTSNVTLEDLINGALFSNETNGNGNKRKLTISKDLCTITDMKGCIISGFEQKFGRWTSKEKALSYMHENNYIVLPKDGIL